MSELEKIVTRLYYLIVIIKYILQLGQEHS